MAKKQIVKIAAFLAKKIEEQGVVISKVILFGSQARGGASAESDIDIAIVSADFRGIDIFQRTRMIWRAGAETIRKFAVPVDLVLLSPEELKSKSSLVAGYVRAGEVLLAA